MTTSRNFCSAEDVADFTELLLERLITEPKRLELARGDATSGDARKIFGRASKAYRLLLIGVLSARTDRWPTRYDARRQKFATSSKIAAKNPAK
jgi:hypothetical protein